MSNSVVLEESVDDDGRWIPKDTFMWRDTIPGVGMFLSVYRATREANHCTFAINNYTPSAPFKNLRGLVRASARISESIGVIACNFGAIYLIDLINN